MKKTKKPTATHPSPSAHLVLTDLWDRCLPALLSLLVSPLFPILEVILSSLNFGQASRCILYIVSIQPLFPLLSLLVNPSFLPMSHLPLFMLFACLFLFALGEAIVLSQLQGTIPEDSDAWYSCPSSVSDHLPTPSSTMCPGCSVVTYSQ